MPSTSPDPSRVPALARRLAAALPRTPVAEIRRGPLDGGQGPVPQGAIAWEPGDLATLRRGLDVLRPRLEARSRLAVVLPQADAEAAVVALLEAGFAVLGEDGGQPDGAAILVARPDAVRVRTAGEADRPGIRELFRAGFGVERGAEAWAWKYDRGPAGPGAASVAVDDDGRIVAHYAGFPVRFRAGEDGTVTAFHVGDITSARRVRHRGRGATSVFGRVNRHFHAVHCGGRVAFNYGFNTGTSRAFASRFAGALEVEPVPYRRRDAGAPAGGARYRVASLTRVGSELDRFFDRMAPAYGTLAVRDARYLGWRYFARPDAEYLVLAARSWGRLRGWAVFRRQEHRLLWGDALVDPAHPGAASALLAGALALPAHRGVQMVEAWFPRRPATWNAVLDGLGFEVAPEPRDLSLVCVPHLMPDAAAFLRRAYVTMGDGDLF